MKKSPIISQEWPNPMTDDPPVVLERWNSPNMTDEGWPTTRDDGSSIRVRDILLHKAPDKLWTCIAIAGDRPIWEEVKSVGLDAEQVRVAWKAHWYAFGVGAGEMANLPDDYEPDYYDDRLMNDTDNPPEKHWPHSLWKHQ